MPDVQATRPLRTSSACSAQTVSRSAVIYEGDEARVWVVRDDRSIELRRIKPGNIFDGFVQVLSGLRPGERIISKGSLFIDRLAAPSVTDRN